MRLINADALKDRLLKINFRAMRKNGMPINLIDGMQIALGCLNDMKTIDAEPVRHGTWKHIKKHLWHKDKNGKIDMWYVDHGFHNGPGCEICGLSFCEHCEPDWAEDECRIGYYTCSECEQPTKTGDSNYCPNCGAKMDLEDAE